MKLNYKSSLSFIACLAIVMPMSAFADDQKQDENKPDAKKQRGQRHGAEVPPQRATQASPQAGGRSRGENMHNEGQGKTSHSNVSPATTQREQPSKQLERNQRPQTQPNVAPMSSQRVQPANRLERSQRNQPQSNVAPMSSRSMQPNKRLTRSAEPSSSIFQPKIIQQGQ